MHFPKLPIRQFHSQKYLLFHHFDPIVRGTSGKASPKSVRRQILGTTIFYLSFLLFGIYGILPHFEVSYLFSLDFYTSHPYAYYHQMWPRRSWAIARILFLIFNTGALVSFGIFLWHPTVQEKYRMAPSGGMTHSRQVLSPADSLAIHSLRRKYRFLVYLNFAFFTLYILLFAALNVTQNGLFQWNTSNTLFWFVAFPLAIAYYVHFTFSQPIFASLTAKILAIKQRALLLSLKKVNKSFTKRRLASNWQQCRTLNGKLLRQCKTTEAYNRFWSPYMTTIFVCCIIKMCYEAFVTIFYGKYMTWTQLLLFLFYPFIHSLQMIAYIRPCSSIHLMNKRILIENRRFYVKMTKESKSKRIATVNYLKAEWLLDSDRLEGYSFTLFVNYPITHDLYHELISFVTALFLLIIKRHIKARAGI